MNPLATLRDSVAAANQAPPVAVDSAITRCPLGSKWALEVDVLGTDDKPVAGITVLVAREGGGERRVRSGSDGRARVAGLDAGSYSLSLPDLDADTWEQVDVSPLPPALARSGGDVTWGTAAQASDGSTVSYRVEDGACFSSVAFSHGFLPETLAALADNAWINEPGRDPHILFHGNPDAKAEAVAVPPPRAKSIEANTGNRYTVRHKGVPDYLRVQLIAPDGEPRANLPFLLEIDDPEGGPPLLVDGETDSNGLLEAPIPPDATRAVATLGRGRGATTVVFDIGYLEPIEYVAGVQNRLENLGYSCGSDAGKLGLATNWALRRFQAANDLPVTGKIDSATKAALLEQHHA